MDYWSFLLQYGGMGLDSPYGNCVEVSRKTTNNNYRYQVRRLVYHKHYNIKEILLFYIYKYNCSYCFCVFLVTQSEGRNDVDRLCLPPSYADVEKHPSIYIININTAQEEIPPPTYDTAMTSNLMTENNESQSNIFPLVVVTEHI